MPRRCQDGRGHGGERTLAGSDSVGRSLDEAVAVTDAYLRGEVVHLVVHGEAQAVDGDAGAEEAVEGVGIGDGVALGIDDGELGGLGSLRRGGHGWRRRQEAGGADEVLAGGGLAGCDGLAPCIGVGGVGHLFQRGVG